MIIISLNVPKIQLFHKSKYFSIITVHEWKKYVKRVILSFSVIHAMRIRLFLYVLIILLLLMNNKRILWVDYLKVVAIIGVLGIHCSSLLLDNKYLFTMPWYESVICSSIFRFAIILFVMASGYLLLRKPQPVTIIPHRLKRILIPFIFWFMVYSIIKVMLKGALGPSGTILDFIHYLLDALLNPLNVSVQFWYVYMILGLYLFSPILSKWIQNANISDIEYFLLIWVLVSILQFTNVDTVITDYLRYFTGSIGYFIMGYYLTIKDHELLTNKKFGFLLFIIGSLITISGTIILSHVQMSQSLFFIRLGDITPGACLQSIGLFIIVKNMDYKQLGESFNGIITTISKDSYGIYLVNILVINLLEKINIINFMKHTTITIIFTMGIVLLISTIIIELFYRIPLLRPFSAKGRN